MGTCKMRIFGFFGLSVLVGASVLPNENRAKANNFLQREKRRMQYLEYYDTYEEFKEASRYLSITVSEAISQDEESQDEVEEQREQPIRCLRRCTDTQWKGGKYVIVKVPCPG